jgi:hypothetical protein
VRPDASLALTDKSVNKHPCTCQPRAPHLSLSPQLDGVSRQNLPHNVELARVLISSLVYRGRVGSMCFPPALDRDFEATLGC